MLAASKADGSRSGLITTRHPDENRSRTAFRTVLAPDSAASTGDVRPGPLSLLAAVGIAQPGRAVYLAARQGCGSHPSDYGAGDQALRQKFLAAGYRGSYETFDVSPEFETTWRDPEAIRGPFGAVLCLEVIEHMSLSEGLALRDRLLSFVQPGGWLVLSTPNPACIISPFSRDETHLQLYPLHDLITWALAAGLDVEARRVKLLPDRVTLKTRVQMAAQRVICYLTGADRADGLIVISSRPR